MAQNETVVSILNAAEALFAERGFSETSLRTITGAAGVNLAAVNYHFGSKKDLVQALFARFLTPFCEMLETEIINRQEDGNQPIELVELLSSIVEVAVEVERQRQEQGAPGQFMRLLGLAYTQGQGHIKDFIVANYGDFYEKLIALLSSAAPDLDPVEFFWRIHFMLGATVFTMSSFDALQSIAIDQYGRQEDVESVLNRLVPVAAAMLQVGAVAPADD